MSEATDRAREVLEWQPGDDNYLDNSRQHGRWLHVANAALNCLEAQWEAMKSDDPLERYNVRAEAWRKFEEATGIIDSTK